MSDVGPVPLSETQTLELGRRRRCGRAATLLTKLQAPLDSRASVSPLSLSKTAKKQLQSSTAVGYRFVEALQGFGLTNYFHRDVYRRGNRPTS